MKRLKAIFLTAFAALSFASFLAAQSYAETIENFKSEINIREDSSLAVTEEITIYVENRDVKRGIVRDFPVEYEDENGRSFNVGFSVESVLLDGVPVDYDVYYESGYARVKIGDRNRIIPRGSHTFTIAYTTTRQIGFFDDFDELYWNVTGNAWSWRILNASCTVSLPAKYGSAPFRSVEWYVGRYGEKGNAADAERSGEKSVSTTRALAVGEGLTVVYTWEKGLVSEPAPLYGNETAQSVIAALTAALSLAWLFFAKRRAPDAQTPAVIARFYPPDGASPAFVRYIKSQKTDDISMTADIIGLAVKGALKIKEEESEPSLFLGKTKKTFSLEKTDASPELADDENALMQSLFSGAKDITLNEEGASRVVSARNALAGAVSILKRGLTKDNKSLCVTGALIFIAGIASTLPFTGEELDVTMASAFFGGIVVLYSLTRKFRPASSFGAALKNVLTALAPALVLSCFSALAFGYGAKIILPFMAAAAATAVTRALVCVRTQRGAELESETAGLELYITVAEKDRMEMLNAPEETPEVFERLLPYALALDAADVWGKRFAKTLEAANYSPEWYAGPSPFTFVNVGGINSFSNAIGSSISSLPSAVKGMKPVRAPSMSSGSGGRGFSGGGGGGGGGSGW